MTDLVPKPKIPALRILTDRALLGLADAAPACHADLLAVPGVGPTIAAKHGRALLALCSS